MPLSLLRKDLKKLKLFIGEIDNRYLEPHMLVRSFAPPSRAEELDVAAFAVLAHGAFENYVEGIALWVLVRVEANWLRKRVSRSTVALLRGASTVTDFAEESTSVFDQIRASVTDLKASHSKVVERNHGIALKHLRRLLLPVGVDVPTDPVLMGSLDVLIKLRHDWAHQYRYGAKTTRSAADVRTTAQDCLVLAEKLCNGALALKL